MGDQYDLADRGAQVTPDLVEEAQDVLADRLEPLLPRGTKRGEPSNFGPGSSPPGGGHRARRRAGASCGMSP
ncbi:hypothetical protein GCM10010347_51910 [Streptomyces cirratus]|uniref:Uncharacterized protein n=1 Tax=Streptomyces cirratus TaxID=68187 RepID=A0ABQ3EYW2_9ACTN|nr:hypothetical protein GCM10010347_51910 [Streptomyces cirratus]